MNRVYNHYIKYQLHKDCSTPLRSNYSNKLLLYLLRNEVEQSLFYLRYVPTYPNIGCPFWTSPIVLLSSYIALQCSIMRFNYAKVQSWVKFLNTVESHWLKLVIDCVYKTKCFEQHYISLAQVGH